MCRLKREFSRKTRCCHILTIIVLPILRVFVGVKKRCQFWPVMMKYALKQSNRPFNRSAERYG
jgi:hypothetical protein